ncbi:MAG: SDR family NAD(P)-dependent oxidoreductase [candidate division Zixibacteria bacterium]|nr:SDR family NAD(P)-dependent oxidoreductase [candidate division Zixibacteria bacterium]
MSTTDKKILVTGADGFIGSHLTEALVREGYSVRAFVMYNSLGHWGWLEQAPPEIKNVVEIMAGDIRDRAFVRRTVSGVHFLFHLASLVAIPYSYLAEESFVDTNIKGTLNLLQAARESGVEKFFHTSTSEIYGTAQQVPMDEKHPATGQSPYAATKIAADAMAEAFRRSYAVPVTILRPFNTYGPRQSARAVIPTIITQIATGVKKIRLGSLTPRRDFTFVEDIVRAFTAAAAKDNLTGEAINIGSGEDIAIGELAEKIAGLMHQPVKIIEAPERIRPENSEVQRLVCDRSKAGRLLGWQPETKLDDGLKKTIAWFSDEKNRAGYKTDRYNI